MVTAFTIVCILFILTNVAVTIKLSLGKSVEPESPVMRSFICPYCENLVHGLTELDRALHVLCIAKSKADLEAEAEKTKKQGSTADEYFVETKKYKAWDSSQKSLLPNCQTWAYNTGTGYYDAYEGNVYRNGEKISVVYGGTTAGLEAVVKTAIDLDKHKQKAKRKKR